MVLQERGGTAPPHRPKWRSGCNGDGRQSNVDQAEIDSVHRNFDSRSEQVSN
jgi:hypothetical protein